ncbi:MAG: universal stress protein [Bacteroidota bacterium]
MEVKSNRSILFPYDFSGVSDCAQEHMVGIARLFGYSIKLLNILDPGTKAYMRKNRLNMGGLKAFLEEMADKFRKEHSQDTEVVIKNVSILKMRKLADSLNVACMVLGIEEPKRRASSIMKVVTKSPVPVFVIQKGAVFSPYKNILFPLDDAADSLQKVGWATAIAKATGATVHIFSVKPSAIPLKEKQYKQIKMVEQVENFFDRHHVEYTTNLATGSLDDFADETIAFGKTVNSDLYIILNRTKKLFSRISSLDMHLIFNHTQTPAICVNKRDLLVAGGFS